MVKSAGIQMLIKHDLSDRTRGERVHAVIDIFYVTVYFVFTSTLNSTYKSKMLSYHLKNIYIFFFALFFFLCKVHSTYKEPFNYNPILKPNLDPDYNCNFLSI